MEEKSFFEMLGENLKAEGMPVVEQLAEKVYAAVTKTGKEFAAASSNQLVKTMVPVALTALDSIAIPAIDKIDGQPG